MGYRMDEHFTRPGGAYDLIQGAFGQPDPWTYRTFDPDGAKNDRQIKVVVKEFVPDSTEARQETYQLRALVTSESIGKRQRGAYLIDPDGQRYVVDDFEDFRNGTTHLFLVRAHERT